MARPASLHSSPARWRAWWIGAGIFAITVLAYGPALRGGLLWDDADHITKPELRSWQGLERIWCEVGATQQYYPALHTAFWIEHRLWGDATLGYHLLNVLLHAAAACLLGLILRRLLNGESSPSTPLRASDSGKVAGGHERRRYAGVEWFAALLFALHPVGVESVAWIAEQKNTLSLAFGLAALLVYLQFDERRSWGSYLGATGLFVLALLSKSVTATLPAALLVILWWRRGRLSWRREVGPLLPWLVAGGAFGLLTVWVERRYIHAAGAEFDLSLVQRCLVAGRASWFYLGKLLWPADLVFIYPRWRPDAGAAWQYGFPLAALGALVGLWVLRKRTRAPLAVALLFVGTLFPALGFFNAYPFRFSFVADHFQYGASLSILALAAAGWARIGTERMRWQRWTLGALLLGALGMLTWSQCGMYRDAETLYRTTLQRNPGCWLAHNNLGGLLTATNRPAAAVDHFEQALRLDPGNVEAEYNLGVALTALGRRDEAIACYTAVLRLDPRHADAEYNLGNLLLDTGRVGEASTHFEAALRVNPDDPQAENNLGFALTELGRPQEALGHFARALQLKPDYAEAENSWGYALLVMGRNEEAMVRFTRALRLAPERFDFHQNLGLALAATGRVDEAIAQFAETIRLKPDYADAHLALALVLAQVGRTQEAAAQRDEGMRLKARHSAERP